MTQVIVDSKGVQRCFADCGHSIYRIIETGEGLPVVAFGCRLQIHAGLSPFFAAFFSTETLDDMDAGKVVVLSVACQFPVAIVGMDEGD